MLYPTDSETHLKPFWHSGNYVYHNPQDKLISHCVLDNTGTHCTVPDVLTRALPKSLDQTIYILPKCSLPALQATKKDNLKRIFCYLW